MIPHTPTPSPHRAKYGFVLYLASYSGFIVYLMWVLLPDAWLHYIGFTFLPQKYWAVAVPVYICVTVAVVTLVFYPLINLSLMPPMNDIRNIKDEYSYFNNAEDERTQDCTIPPVSDIPLKSFCEDMYLNYLD